MTLRLVLFAIMLLLSLQLRAQCGQPQFSVVNDGLLCRSSPIRLVNEDTEAVKYYWDFCPETFSEQGDHQAIGVTGLAQGYGYRLIEENGQWYGFVVSRSLDKLIRLDFGNNPSNSPTVTDLGNPGGLMDAPEGLDFYKQGDEWFAFVGKGENGSGQIVKLSFGSNLAGTPAATGYGTFGLGSIRIRDLKITKQGNDIILVLLLYNTSSLNRINFGNSLNNAPAPNNVIALPGASLPRGIDLVRVCGSLRAHVVSENGLVQQISFGNDIWGPITVEGGYTFPSVFQPWKVRIVNSGGKYFSFISNNNRKFSIIDFDDLSLTTAPVEVPNSIDTRFIGLDIKKHHGRVMVQGGGGAGSLLSVSYQNSCSVDTQYSDEKNPASIRYTTNGTFLIDLIAFESESEFSSSTKALEIRDLDATQIDAMSDGMCEGNEVIFSTSNNHLISSWAWAFGNGLTSSLQTPATSYLSEGAYTVSVDAVGVNSCHTGDQLQIKIYASPAAEFLMPSGLLCTNNAFLFSTTTPDIYDGNLSYSWFVDNTLVSIERDLEYTFQNIGTKEVTFLVSIPGCADGITKTTSFFESGPRVDFSFTGICEDESYSFKGQFLDPVQSFSWDFGDGQTSLDTDPEHAFLEAASYPVSLSAINSVGCETIKTKTIAVHSRPIVDFAAAGPPNTCSSSNVLFQNLTTNPDSRQITDWLWEFGDSDNNGGTTEMNGRHVFIQPGAYDVSLTATTIGGCSRRLEKQITVYPSPSTDFTSTPFCEDKPVTFSASDDPGIDDVYWEIGNSYYDGPSIVHTFPVPGNYSVYAEFSGTNGCFSTVTKTIHVPAPLAPDFSAIKHCVGEEAVFTDITSGIDPVVSRQWQLNDVDVSTGTSFNHSFAAQGTAEITLKVSAQSGCVYEVSKQIEVVHPPVAAFTSSPSLGAYPVEVSFTNASSGATGFRWDFMDGTGATSAVKSPTYIFNTEGSFPVVLTAFNDRQCEDSFQQTITTVAPLPDADLEMLNMTTNPDGSTKLIVTIHNKGNTILKGLPLDFDFGGGLQLRQNLQQDILPSSRYNFVLNTAVTNIEELRFLCVSLPLDNDLSPADNRICREFENKLFVFPVYPNPVAENLTLEWISGTEKFVRILLNDQLGRAVFDSTLPAAEGLNISELYTRAFQPGVYFLSVDDGASKMTQRIVIIDGR